MATRRMSIKLYVHERQELVELYLQRRIPIDQYESRPRELEALADEWNQRTGRKDAPGDLLHYMRTQRKRSKWVRFDGEHEPAPAVAELSAEETEILVEIFQSNVTVLESGSDVLAYDDEIAQLIAKEFSAETGRVVPAHVLVAKLTALRKRGLLPKVGKRDHNDEERGFTDIDEAIG